MDKTLYVGAARQIITPAVGTLLFGYRPDVVSTSVHDDLNVTAIALEQGDTKAVLVSATVCELENEIADAMRDAAAKETGLDRDVIIVTAIHNHSGPATKAVEGWGALDTDFCYNILIPRTALAVREAWNTRKPAKLGIGTRESHVGVNRRQILPDGSIILGQNPHGVFDPTMTMLSFCDASDNSPIINLVHYGCHGTAAGMNHEISRDWSGIMVDRLEKQFGGLSTFFIGACGDAGPRLSNGSTTGDITHVEELGSVAAMDACALRSSIRDFREDIDLKVAIDEVRLPYRPLLPEEECLRRLTEYKEPEKLVNIERLEYDQLQRILAFHRSGAAPEKEFTFRQTLVRLGPVVFIPFPFEIFGDITLRLREYNPWQHTLSLSNALGQHGYFPSRDQLALGGYEVRCFTMMNTFCLTDDADSKIIAEDLRIMKQLDT